MKARSKQKRRPAADKFALYIRAVQYAPDELDFIERAFRVKNRRAPRTLLEHFCGTALLASEWVRRGEDRRSVGLDLDPRPLAWGRKHLIEPLGEAGRRVRLLRRDVRAPLKTRHDAICALNFSYWVFQTRDEMRNYFSQARASLARDGVLVLDAYGGWEAVRPRVERRRIRGGATYVWDQESFDPITHRIKNTIHFELANGRKLRRAFSYDWRFWTVPELKNLLEEAGLRDIAVYWDRSRSNHRALYRKTESTDNDPGWLAYIVAYR